MEISALVPEVEKFAWKRLFVKAAGIGAGATSVLLILAAISAWYVNRPVPRKPWNGTAILATYEGLTATTSKPLSATFDYSLENTTDSDYTIPQSARLMARSAKGTLEEQSNQWLPVDVFVPAHHKVRYKFTVSVESGSSDMDPKGTETEKVKRIGVYLRGVKAFVLFDDVNRYEIELKSGWDDLKDRVIE